LAIGVTLASTAQIRAENKGNAIENTLWLNDGLWVMRTGAM
jgi:predicted ribosome-associated RNA-binding protein Tma20